MADRSISFCLAGIQDSAVFPDRQQAKPLSKTSIFIADHTEIPTASLGLAGS
jgi:hypothetical protein